MTLAKNHNRSHPGRTGGPPIGRRVVFLHTILLALLGVACLAAEGGCGAPPKLVHDGQWHCAECRGGRWRPAGRVPDIKDFVIVVDGQGVPRDPKATQNEVKSVEDFEREVDRILAEMKSFHDRRAGKHRKVLIFVHGGLNGYDKSLRAADKEIDSILDAGYYPIFLNWNSKLGDAYGEHLTRITHGRTDDGWPRWLMWPLYLFADIGRATTRAPVVWAHQIGTDLSTAASNVAPRKTDRYESPPGKVHTISTQWQEVGEGKAINNLLLNWRKKGVVSPPGQSPDEPRDGIRVYAGRELDVTAAHLINLEGRYVLTLPAKFAISPIIDGVGTPAWENMSRRTMMAFDGQLGGNPRHRTSGEGRPSDGAADSQKLMAAQSTPPEDRSKQAVDFDSIGAFEVFRERLLLKIAGPEDGCPCDGPAYEVTLIGHSMGTTVLNEWLRRDVLDKRRPAYKNIVYMGAACSVRDFSRSVIPYLLQHRPDDQAEDPVRKSGTQFYNLMLHPLAELRERERYADLPPRGSLLVWLDDFLANPQGPLNRTLGRFDNIIPALELIPKPVRGQVSMRAFALAPYDDATPPAGEPDYGPQAHDQFRKKPFWKEDFWYSESDDIAPPRNPRSGRHHGQ